MELHDGDFEFIVGDKSYKCNAIIAEFLSPKVCSLRQLDPSINEFRVSIDDPLSQFGSFLSLAFESHLRVDPENFDFYVSVSHELENQELLSQLATSYFERTEMTKSNAVKHLKLREMFGENGQEEIAFIASNFNEIEGLAELEIHHLRQILSHRSLRIPSEDFLYNFICERISKDPSYSELFGFVMFKFLSSTSIQHFIKLNPSIIFDHLNISIWTSLCERLSEKPLINSGSVETQRSRFGDVIIQDEIQQLNNELRSLAQQKEHEESLLQSELEQGKKKEALLQKELEQLRRENEELKQQKEALSQSLVGKMYAYNGSNPFNGIISELRRRCGGNPDEKRLIQVNASSISYNSPHQLLRYDWSENFATEAEPNSWIELDMKGMRVCVTHYTLKSKGHGTWFPKHWVIECRNNKEEGWTTIDERHTDDLCGKSRVKTYRTQCSNWYRYIRMRQTAKNAGDDDTLDLTNIEIFGSLLSH